MLDVFCYTGHGSLFDHSASLIWKRKYNRYNEINERRLALEPPKGTPVIGVSAPPVESVSVGEVDFY